MRRVGIELDGTILRYKTDELFDVETNRFPYGKFGEVTDGAKEALQTLKDLGYEVVIITHRNERAMIRSLLLNTLRLPFDRIVSQSNELAFDYTLGAGCVSFNGSWKKAVSDLEKLMLHGTWEEKRRKGEVQLGLHDSVKGHL